MPVDAIQPYQIIIMVAFLLLLMMALFLVRRFRGGLTKHIQRSKRMRHIEDMALTSHQRLHLVEVDSQTFMVHSGRGHAATVVEVSGSMDANCSSDVEAPMTLMDIQKPTAKQSSSKSEKTSKQPVRRAASADSSGVLSANQKRSKANVDQIASAIAEARRRNPSLRLEK